MLTRLKTLRLIQDSFQAAQLCIASSNLARVLQRVNTWCTMRGSAGPEGDEEDMSDDGDDAGEDAPEDDVQDDAVHTFQGHSGMRLLAYAPTCIAGGIHIYNHRMSCSDESRLLHGTTHSHADAADAVFAVAWNAASPGTVASGSADDTVYMFQVCLLAQPHVQHAHSVAVCHSVRMMTVTRHIRYRRGAQRSSGWRGTPTRWRPWPSAATAADWLLAALTVRPHTHNLHLQPGRSCSRVSWVLGSSPWQVVAQGKHMYNGTNQAHAPGCRQGQDLGRHHGRVPAHAGGARRGHYLAAVAPAGVGAGGGLGGLYSLDVEHGQRPVHAGHVGTAVCMLKHKLLTRRTILIMIVH
jgi:hypothetical protein